MRRFGKAIGIVGGAGPAASAFLYRKLIELCQREGAHDYHEFPEIIIESFPFVRRDEEKIQRDLALCFEKLQRAGAELGCIASHSFHRFVIPSTISFVSLVEESLKEVQRFSKVLVLAAQKTIDCKLYESKGVEIFYPPKPFQERIQ